MRTELSVVTCDLRSICAGDEKCDTELNVAVVTGATAIPFGFWWVHLFLPAEEAINNNGSATPFLTALNMIDPFKKYHSHVPIVSKVKVQPIFYRLMYIYNI